MIIYNKNGFIKFECPSCLNRFRVTSSDFKGDFCDKCNKVIIPFKIIVEEIKIDQSKIDQSKIETHKIVNKKTNKKHK